MRKEIYNEPPQVERPTESEEMAFNEPDSVSHESSVPEEDPFDESNSPTEFYSSEFAESMENWKQ